MVGDKVETELPKMEVVASANAVGSTPTVTTLDLLGTRRELFIDHRGEVYRLRITRNDKLILTK